jgi:DNA-binding NarL/FixJ family response regulator
MREVIENCRVIREGMPLSNAEKRVYEELLTSDMVKQIAPRLFVSERTVKFHANHIYIKLGINSRLELIVNHYESLLKEKAA